MHVVIASKSLGEPDGGSQRSMLALARHLASLGARVTMIAVTLPAEGPFERRAVNSSVELGQELARARPDVVLTQLEWSADAIAAAHAAGAPAVFFSRLGECQLAADLVVFNSEFCASRYPRLEAEAIVVPPVVGAPIAPPPQREGRDVVVMINPIRLKGGDRLERTAPLTPELRYLAVGGWWPPSQDGIDLDRIPNVEHAPAVADMSGVWSRAILLMVPSAWPEPAGRVLVESCAAGVPVVVSDTGGMTELHGGVGVVVDDPDDARAWAREIRTIAHDRARWEELSSAGQEQAERFQRATAGAVDALVGRLGKVEVAKPARSARLLIPPELYQFDYLAQNVFDFGANDFRS